MSFVDWALGSPGILRDTGPVPEGRRLTILDACRRVPYDHSVERYWQVEPGDVIEIEHAGAKVHFLATGSGEAWVATYACRWPMSLCPIIEQVGKVYG